MKARYLLVGVLALVTASLWAAVLLGNPSGRGGSPHLPALNGTPPPAITPEPAGSPPASQTPGGSSPGLQAARPHASSTGLEPTEDEAEDEPPSAEGGPSTSGGQSLLPSTPQLPVALPSLAPLGLPPHLP